MGDSLEENITLGQQSDKIDKEKINQSIEFAELKFRSKNEENRKDIEERGKKLIWWRETKSWYSKSILL